MRANRITSAQCGTLTRHAFVLLFLLLIQHVLWGDPLDVWIPRRPILQTGRDVGSITFNGIAYANGIFVTVGNAGSIRISEDGDYWAAVDSGSVNRLNGIAHGNGVFVAVGERGTILHSPNGYAWEIQTTPTANNLRDIAFLKGMFVSVGEGGTILRSIDGKFWARIDVTQSASLYGITGGNGVFVGVGGQSVVAPSVILSSTDGTVWRSQDSKSTNFLRGITYGGGTFVAAGNNGTILTSSDAENWTKQTSGTVQNIHRVAYGNGLFIGLRSPVGITALMISSNGTTWSERVVPNPNLLNPSFLNAVIYGAGQFIAVGERGTLVASQDAVAWVDRSQFGRGVTAVAFGNGNYVAVGSPGSENCLNILTSTNAINWNRANCIPVSHESLAVAYGGGQFVAVGRAGSICSSRDGKNWKLVQVPFLFGTPITFNAITYGQEMFVAVGDPGQIFTSSDGLNWIRQESGTSKALFSIANGNGVFVVGSHGSEFLISTDSFTWNSRKLSRVGPDLNYAFEDIVYGDRLFCASALPRTGADQTHFYISSDALTWTQVFAVTNRTVPRMSFGNGNYVAVGWGETDRVTGGPKGAYVVSSQDGTNWVQRTCGLETAGHESMLTGICYGDGTFVAVGPSSTIIQSGTLTGGARLLNVEYSRGRFSADIEGMVGQVYQLQAAQDLFPASWMNYRMVTNWISPVRFDDANSGSLKHRFYRVIPP